MANGINLGEALVSLIGGLAGGYGRGRTYRAERQSAEDERQRKIANEQRVFEKRQQEINEQVAGKKEAFGLLNAVGGLSPQTPAEEVLKIKAQYLDAADRGGMSVKEAQDIFDEAVKFRTPQQPDPSKQTFSVPDNIADTFGLPRGTRLTADDLRQLSSTETLNRQRESQIKENEANIARIQKATEKIKKDLAEKPEKVKEEDLIKELREVGLALNTVDPGSDAEKALLQVQNDLSLSLRKKRAVGRPATGSSTLSVPGGASINRTNLLESIPVGRESAFQEGATATNPQTGEKIIFKDGKWQSLQ